MRLAGAEVRSVLRGLSFTLRTEITLMMLFTIVVPPIAALLLASCQVLNTHADITPRSIRRVIPMSHPTVGVTFLGQRFLTK